MLGKKTTRSPKKTALFLVIFCSLLLLWHHKSLRKTSVCFLDDQGVKHLLSLSIQEREILSEFMIALFAEDYFAYTLMGSKPTSWACYKKNNPLKPSLFYNIQEIYYSKFQLGWKIWSKYKNLFPKTIFWIEPIDAEYFSILLVNKEKFNEVINQHKQEFENILDRKITDGFQLLQEAEDHNLLHGILHSHQGLMGIILGYGRDNSWGFLESCRIRVPLGSVWGEFNNEIRKRMETFPENPTIEESLSLLSLPNFAGFPDSEESLALKKEYLETQKKLIAYYQDKDFLEATLSLLAGFRPIDT